LFATRYFTKSHEYIDVDGEKGTVGITDHAQSALGDIVFFDAPQVGSKVTKGGNLAAVESVKASAVVYSPVAGTIAAVNDAVVADNTLINKSAEKDGWLARINIANPPELKTLLDQKAYDQFLKEEAAKA